MAPGTADAALARAPLRAAGDLRPRASGAPGRPLRRPREQVGQAFTLIEPFDGLTTHQGERGAFTLIELLVVIAIIALLITILMPSLERARDLAHDAVCASSIRAIGMGDLLYANDSDGYLTTAATGWPRPAGKDCLVDVHEWEKTRGILWYETLQWGGYVPGLRAFADPADTNAAKDPDLAFVSYGINAYIARGAERFTGDHYRIENVVSPQWTILIAPNNASKASHTGIWNYARPDAHRHTGYRAFYSFCDGHVAAITFEEMFDVAYEPDWPYEWHWIEARPEYSAEHNWSDSPDRGAEEFDHWAPWELGGEFTPWGDKRF
jgi:prepilin-type N-terminal cleavage/methylation domain-containing protein/prepilin-type processing-associated H-X9-DG protein